MWKSAVSLGGSLETHFFWCSKRERNKNRFNSFIPIIPLQEEILKSSVKKIGNGFLKLHLLAWELSSVLQIKAKLIRIYLLMSLSFETQFWKIGAIKLPWFWICMTELSRAFSIKWWQKKAYGKLGELLILGSGDLWNANKFQYGCQHSIDIGHCNFYLYIAQVYELLVRSFLISFFSFFIIQNLLHVIVVPYFVDFHNHNLVSHARIEFSTSF